VIILKEGRQFVEHKFGIEKDFESVVIQNHHEIFGKDVIYIDAKKKIESTTLGSSIPDGFLFNMSDPNNIEFYLVEVELETHDFYKHIFPQITKFFGFFRNSNTQKELVEKLFSTINTDAHLNQRFKKYLKGQEIFKFLNDVIDSSQNILIIMDGNKPELPEITETYFDTWGKMVRILTVKQFTFKDEELLTVDPEFESIEFSFEETPEESEKKPTKYSEEIHLDGSNDAVKDAYQFLKSKIKEIDSSCVFNPQKYYISIKAPQNIVYFQIRKKKIRMVAMMPEDEIRNRILHHPITSLTEGVQKFYNGPCATIDIIDSEYIEEIVKLIEHLIDEMANKNIEEELD